MGAGRKEGKKEGRKEGERSSQQQSASAVHSHKSDDARGQGRGARRVGHLSQTQTLRSQFLLLLPPLPPSVPTPMEGEGGRERVYSQDCRSRSISNSDPRTARRPTARVPSHSLTPNCSLGGRGCSAKEPGGPDVTLPLSLSLFSRREIVMRLK